MIDRYIKGTLYTSKKSTREDYQDRVSLLKKLIKKQLDQCDYTKWPKVCELQTTTEGYKRIESMIINYAVTEGMPIGSAIALIEQEFTHSNG